MNEIKVSMNRNGLLSKKITFKILNGYNNHVHDIDIFINDKWRKYAKNQFVDHKFSDGSM